MKRGRSLVLFLASICTIATAQGHARVPCKVTIPTTIGDDKGYDTISFKVLDGVKPLAAAPVRLYKGRRLVLSLTTDARGLFSLRGIAPAEYRLHVGGWGDATLRVATLSKVRFVVDEFTLYAASQSGCPKFLGGID